MAKNLKTATENINNNKKSTKCNQFIGNVDACNIINALGNSVSAEIHIRLEVIRKRSTIGKLADAIRKIDCKNVDAECSIEGLESKIISSVKRPVHDITLCHNGALHIFDATCKYLKKQKDIKVDEDLLYPLTAEYKEIFMFVNRLCSREHKKPEYAIGNFSNEKYNNGIITFTFKNCKFIYNISSDSVEFEPEQKDELLVRSERLNKQKRNIKICKKACEALKTEYGLCCRIKKGKLVIKGNRCLGALTISSENKIISADIKKWCKESRKNFEEEEKRKKEEKYDKIRILKSYSNLLCIDVLRVIAKNERYITETAVVKNLRGMTQTLSSNVENIENSGKYEILTNEEIQTAIRQLLKDNLIYERELKGTYGRFDILKLEEKASDIFSTPFKETDKSFSAFTDLDWVNYLKKIKENGKEPRLSKAKKEQQLTLLEHKTVIAVYPELVKELQPDSLLIAFGAVERILPIPGVEGEKVQLATKAIAHPEQLGQNIVILGGGSIGCEIGLELAENGKNVTILELTDTLAANANSLYREALRQKFLLHENLHSLLKCGCSRIEEDVVIYKNESGEEKQLPYDQLILSTGLVAQRQLVESFYGICRDTVAIGDCVSPSNIMNANFEGYTAALNI